MTEKLLRFLICSTLFIAISFCVTGCRSKKTGPGHPPPSVTTVVVEPQDIPAVFEFVGFTQSSHFVEVRARVEGYLDKIAYKEGSLVKEGEILFQIDPRPFQAALEEAKGTLLQKEALLWNAKKTAERYKVLYEQKAASQRDLDNAVADQLSLEAQVVSATGGVESAALNLEFTTIKSSINGLSARSIYREGDLITPGPNGLLTSIQAVDPTWVYFSVSENQLLKYRDMEHKGQLVLSKDKRYELQLVLADNSIYPYLGKVDFSQPYFDQKTGTMTVRGIVPNPKNALMPGQFVRIKVLGAIYPNTIAVPQEAVMQGKTGMYVFIVSDGRAHMQNVVTGDWFENKWIILGGLLKGDEVIAKGAGKVMNNMPVFVENQSPNSKTNTPPETPKKELQQEKRI